MTYELEIRSIALFYFFAVLDSRKAQELAVSATKVFKRKLAADSETRPSVAMVAATKFVWDQKSASLIRGRPNYAMDSGWVIPRDLDMSPWMEFQKTAQEEELLAIIWFQILKISEIDIAEGLKISQGTLRYRVGRGLRKLGTIALPGGGKAAKLGIAPI
jgi:DNA-binding CsgD family transcriptional regulator